MTPILLLAAALSFSPAQEGDLRGRAASSLRAALDGLADGAPLAEALDATRAAARDLAEDGSGASLDELVLDTRWRAVVDPDHARAELVRELERTVDDLEFEPLMEAPLPEGFPEPTPVGAVRLVRYPTYRLARTDMDGGAFWKLFQHIESRGIPMTAPVETTLTPVESGWREADMAFLYASTGQGPVGEAGPVEVVDAMPTTVVSTGCRGNTTRTSLDAARARLERWLASHPEWEAAGSPRVMSYNSPMVRGERRFFEVEIPVTERTNTDGEVVIDFTSEDAAPRFATINDGVMGGLSTSRIEHVGESTVFTGEVSLENNGGFASVRSRPADLGLAETGALVLRFRGDGKTYKLRLRTDEAFDGVSWEASFATEADEWTTRRFELDDFAPVWRGRRVRGAEPLTFEDVRTVGFLVSDEQVGPFRLELAELRRD